jgi:hypothetical protein
MANYQISLLGSAGHTVSSLNARCANDPEALGLAHRMLDGRGHPCVWTGARCVGEVSEASGAHVEALGQLWASQPANQA